ncbi:MAG: VOC family protein [Chloroflexi bacterium]|nr:VOC family protein [Chloroflexota bacterium]
MKLHHIAILTQDLETSIPFWRDILGLPEKERKVVHREGVEVAFLAVGDAWLELVQPIHEESPVARQVHHPGTKLHHVCLEVENIEQLHIQLTEAKVQLVQDAVQVHEDGTRYFFVHPKSTGGVLLEIYETIQPADG